MATHTIPTTKQINYDGPLFTPYTGTPDQPDNISVFFKNAQGEIIIHNEAILNSLDHKPLLFSYATWRVQEAAEKIFSWLKGENVNPVNAFKNLTRGMVALVPLIGNGVLYLYDALRTHFYTHPQVKAALADLEGQTLGFAFDGKVVSTFSLGKLEALLGGGKIDSDPDAVLIYFWLKLLNNGFEKNSAHITRAELVNRLTRRANGTLFPCQ